MGNGKEQLNCLNTLFQAFFLNNVKHDYRQRELSIFGLIFFSLVKLQPKSKVHWTKTVDCLIVSGVLSFSLRLTKRNRLSPRTTIAIANTIIDCRVVSGQNEYVFLAFKARVLSSQVYREKIFNKFATLFTKRTRFFRATMMWRVKIEKKKEKNLKPQRLALRASSLKILMVLPWKKWTNQTNVNASSFIRLFKWPETYLYLMRTSISTHHHHHRRRMPIIIHCSEQARNPLRMVLLLFHVNWMRTRKKVWWKIEYFSRFVARKKIKNTHNSIQNDLAV